VCKYPYEINIGVIFHNLVENVELCKIITDSGKYLLMLRVGIMLNSEKIIK
jgi:hypothetical protein